jgi:RNA polymerase sigma-70 factor (ECF subfamily)
MDDHAPDLTQLLRRWAEGDRDALDRLMPLVYSELRRLANFYLQQERPDHTLQPTALVHEAYLRLVDQRQAQWQNRAQFYGVAAQIMRRILVDYARQHQAEKRRAMKDPLPLDEALTIPVQADLSLVELDRSLEALSAFDPGKCRLVELRFFVGLNVEDTAEMLGVSPATVKREWAVAKAWLYNDMSKRAEA